MFVRAQRSRPGHRGVGGVGVAAKSLQITGVPESGTESKTEPSYGGRPTGARIPEKIQPLRVALRSHPRLRKESFKR